MLHRNLPSLVRLIVDSDATSKEKLQLISEITDVYQHLSELRQEKQSLETRQVENLYALFCMNYPHANGYLQPRFDMTYGSFQELVKAVLNGDRGTAKNILSATVPEYDTFVQDDVYLSMKGAFAELDARRLIDFKEFGTNE